MKSGLIGYTGFVGSNLLRQYDFTDCYNSKNFHEMNEQSYDLVVCAGVSAVKWIANKEPEKDLASIKALEGVLEAVNAKQFILISTIDVYPVMQSKDESFDCASMQNHAYGTHRLAFEKFCTEQFDDCSIVRLPGLFGEGLKKNVIYDLLNDNCLEMINKKSSYQYYFLKHLWRDIQIAIENDIKIINLFTEPVPTQEIYQTFFSSKSIGQEAAPEGHYDLYTKYAKNWNNSDNYIYTKDEMIEQLSDFISSYKKGDS
jgi:nucleoside-diphosphate-sugar epimerase